MRSKFIEAVHSATWGNHGKFEVTVWDAADFRYRSAVDGSRLLGERWFAEHVKVFDVETGEGAVFLHGGKARADLRKRRIWVCPLFEHFLQWLHDQPKEKVLRLDLPDLVYLPDAPFEQFGYRRPGHEEAAG